MEIRKRIGFDKQVKIMLHLINGTVRQSKQYYPQWRSSLPSKADCTSSAIGDFLFGGVMEKIPLTQEKYALIDDEDYPIVSLFKWYAGKDSNTFYASTSITLNGKETKMRMHRLILNAKKGEETDHRDANGLNNQKFNLRKCTRSQNSMNVKKRQGKSSQYKGVSWHKRNRVWVAYIRLNWKLFYLGCFKNEKEAANAYNSKAKELFGNFARLNLIT